MEPIHSIESTLTDVSIVKCFSWNHESEWRCGSVDEPISAMCDTLWKVFSWCRVDGRIFLLCQSACVSERMSRDSIPVLANPNSAYCELSQNQILHRVPIIAVAFSLWALI